MKQKKGFFLVFFICSFAFTVQAQNYFIDFTASGTLSSLDSIYVENLTQGVSLSLSANDTLHLFGTLGLASTAKSEENIKIYPNPFNETSNLEFYSANPSEVDICIYDVLGKIILQTSMEVQEGNNIFEISGFATGYYQLSLTTNTWQKSAAFVSLNTEKNNPEIQLQSSFSNDFQAKSEMQKSAIQMQYNPGDEMLYIGFSGIYSEDLLDIPIATKTVDFVFSSSSCGGSFTDSRDGNIYSSVRIGKQCWMSENLKYLPSVVNSITGSYTVPYYYVYNYESNIVSAAEATANYNIYGVLYNWSAAMDSASSSSSNPSGVQGVCPIGWHLPSEDEFIQLTEYLGGGLVAGGKLRESGTAHWTSPNTGATNESGFTALPAGGRSHTTAGGFNGLNINTSFWTTRGITDTAYILQLIYSAEYVQYMAVNKRAGLSVRCVKD